MRKKNVQKPSYSLLCIPSMKREPETKWLEAMGLCLFTVLFANLGGFPYEISVSVSQQLVPNRALSLESYFLL